MPDIGLSALSELSNWLSQQSTGQGILLVLFYTENTEAKGPIPS